MTHPRPRDPEPAPPSDPALEGRLPRRLPALGLPASRDGRRWGMLISLLVHAALIALLLAPAFALHTNPNLVERAQGAGGPGPAGGGGGGTRGTGGLVPEKLTFVRLAPAAPAPQPVPTPPVVTPPLIVQPPKVEAPKPEAPKVQVPAPAVKAAAPAPASATPGTGGGTGSDGSAGSGPGSGGGVGSGIGPGRGSGTGPGTGGGTQADSPPVPVEFLVIPLPFPEKLRGFHLIAEYDVDVDGKVLDWSFTPTPDREYNKRLEEVLRVVRFRPGTRPDGTPKRMKAQISWNIGS